MSIRPVIYHPSSLAGNRLTRQTAYALDHHCLKRMQAQHNIAQADSANASTACCFTTQAGAFPLFSNGQSGSERSVSFFVLFFSIRHSFSVPVSFFCSMSQIMLKNVLGYHP